MKLKFARYALKRAGDVLLGRGLRFAKRIVPPVEGWHCLAEFSSGIKNRPELGEYNENRVRNMQLCVKMMSGLLVLPGETFSMMDRIGDPTSKRGFAAGPVLTGGGMAMLDGGGLCQVSTTVFNAALLAGLRILEKHNHRYDYWGEARFVELGRDAAYAYILKDLKFRNGRNVPVRMELETDTGTRKFVCRLWSPEPLRETISVRSRVLERYDKPGFNPGWKVRTERFTGTDGAQVCTYSATEIYQPVRRREA